MTPYYVDPAATGTDTGASWTSAWTTLQRAIDGTGGTQPTAGDEVLMRGTETVTVQIDLDGLSGTNGSYVRFTGVNASGVNDGTRYVLSASGSISVLKIPSSPPDYLYFCNIEITGSSGHGIEYNNYALAIAHTWNNVYVHACSDGVHANSQAAQGLNFIQCRFNDNSGDGVDANCYGAYLCEARNNGGKGFSHARAGKVGTALVFYGCLVDGNTGDGIYCSGSSQVSGFAILNCVIDGNATAINHRNYNTVILGNRITSNTTGVDLLSTSFGGSMIYNYMPDTAQDRVNTTNIGGSTPVYISDKAGSDSNNLAGTDTNAGYNAPATGDFNLVSSAAIRDVAVDLDG